MSWGFQGIVTAVRNFLGVPLGASYRPAERSNENAVLGANASEMDLIKSIIDITVDDVCIGSNPFYYKTGKSIERVDKLKYDKILRELNSISKWVARDLLADGCSVYKLVVKDKDVFLYPVLDTVKLVLNEKKEVVAYDEEGNKMTDTIVFVNYDKTCLTVAEGEKYVYNIAPKGIQLANVGKTAQELQIIEKSLLRYRRDVSRILRFVTVEVGVSQGGDNQELIDNISSGINANSLSFETDVNDLFDDEIPVFPTRRGLGKPEFEEHVPSANISDLADLNNVLSKLFLGMRFPKSYADFTEALGSTAVSTIRGDIRYSRVLKATRTLMETTINRYFKDISSIIESSLEFKMQEIPNPEDQEVIESLSGYSDFIREAFEIIIEGSESKEDATYKLNSYKVLLGDSSNLRSIERWASLTMKYINFKFNEDKEVSADSFMDEASKLEEEDQSENIDEPDNPDELDNPDEETNQDELNNPDEGSEETADENSEEVSEEFAPSERPPLYN